MTLENADRAAYLHRQIAQLQAALDGSRAELDLLAYSAVHQMRAPVRALLGLLAVFGEDHAQDVSPAGRALLDQMSMAAGRAAELLEGLIRLARAASQPLQPQWVEVSALVADIVQGLVTDPQRRACWQVAPDLRAWADPVALREVLLEGCRNALHFGGAAPQVQVGAERDGEGRTWLTIRDHGVGFDARHAGKLGQPFQRLHRDDEFAGVGVGLALSARLLARQGGQLILQSAADGGACLRIHLPEPSGQAAAGEVSGQQHCL